MRRTSQNFRTKCNDTLLLLILLLLVWRPLFPCLCGSDVLPMMPHLHFSQSIAISGLSLISFISPSIWSPRWRLRTPKWTLKPIIMIYQKFFVCFWWLWRRFTITGELWVSLWLHICSQSDISQWQSHVRHMIELYAVTLALEGRLWTKFGSASLNHVIYVWVHFLFFPTWIKVNKGSFLCFVI